MDLFDLFCWCTAAQLISIRQQRGTNAQSDFGARLSLTRTRTRTRTLSAKKRLDFALPPLTHSLTHTLISLSLPSSFGSVGRAKHREHTSGSPTLPTITVPSSFLAINTISSAFDCSRTLHVHGRCSPIFIDSHHHHQHHAVPHGSRKLY